jgi:predicted Zn finger-like uncharacterized protein
VSASDAASVRVACPACHKTYRLPLERLQGKTQSLRCAACNHRFPLPSPESVKERPALQVRRRDGSVTPVGGLPQLKRLIIEGAVGPDDALSRDGQTWKRMADLSELAPHFRVAQLTTGAFEPATRAAAESRAQTTEPEPAEVPEAPAPAMARTAPSPEEAHSPSADTKDWHTAPEPEPDPEADVEDEQPEYHEERGESALLGNADAAEYGDERGDDGDLESGDGGDPEVDADAEVEADASDGDARHEHASDDDDDDADERVVDTSERDALLAAIADGPLRSGGTDTSDAVAAGTAGRGRQYLIVALFLIATVILVLLLTKAI